jgi:hypothetical protein
VFPKQRIGRGGIRTWPASSPDLNPVFAPDLWRHFGSAAYAADVGDVGICDNEYRTDFRKLIKQSEFYSESGSHCSDVERTALRFDVDTTYTSFNLQKEIMLQKV